MASAFTKNNGSLFPTGNPPPPSYGNPMPGQMPYTATTDATDPNGNPIDYSQNPSLSKNWKSGSGTGWQTTPTGPNTPTQNFWGGSITTPAGQDGPVYGGGPTPSPSPVADPAGPQPSINQPDYPLADPGYNEDWYKKYGGDLMGSPSASEDLYAKGAAGSNPFYDYAQSQTIKAINDASAARGDFNSSYTLRNIGNAVADLRGQQAHELGQLAGQADSAKLGRYNASEGYSADAQRAMEGRANAGLDRQMSLSNNQAGTVGGFYGEAGREKMALDLAQMEILLKQAGMDSGQAQQIIDAISGIGGIATKAAGSAGK